MGTPPSPLNIAILTGQWGKSGPLLLLSTKSQLEQQKWTTLVQAKCKHIPDELRRWQANKATISFVDGRQKKVTPINFFLKKVKKTKSAYNCLIWRENVSEKYFEIFIPLPDFFLSA